MQNVLVKKGPGVFLLNRFLDREEAVDQFNWLFSWFNTEHLHSGDDYVTPEQCHGGLWEKLPLKEVSNSNNSVC